MRLSSNKKMLVFVSAGILFIGLLIFAIFALFFRTQASEKITNDSPVKLEYCGAELQELCILSFGREGGGDTIVNLFVPQNQFPDFYLKIIKATGESIYECEKNEDIKTSIYCVGEALNLREQIEVTVLSKADDLLLASGKFTLTAFFIGDSQSPPTSTADSTTLTPSAFFPVIRK